MLISVKNTIRKLLFFTFESYIITPVIHPNDFMLKITFLRCERKLKQKHIHEHYTTRQYRHLPLI